jgi:hypothetical protein
MSHFVFMRIILSSVAFPAGGSTTLSHGRAACQSPQHLRVKPK